MIIINEWKKMKLTGDASDFRNFLIGHFKRKFNYELGSDIYQVASVLDINNACRWVNEPFFHELVVSGKIN
jgi:hypothetical protein